MDDYIANLDEQTARLIVKLQLEDLDEVSSKAEGDDPQDASDDFACALATYENDLKAVSDRDMAQSFAHAVRTDAQAIKDAIAENKQASEDRAMALEAEGRPAPVLPLMIEGAAFNADDDSIDDDLLEKMCAVYMGDDEVDNSNPYEQDDIYNDDSAPGYSLRKQKNPVPKLQCCTCGDDAPFYDVAQAPCGHGYCQGCLRELFTLSLTDESLFPPRCCREPIPAEKNRFFIGSKLLREFQARAVEMETPDRTYCHVPECSEFIPPQNVEHQIGRCVACDARTCSICKASAHDGDCPEDPATQMLDAIAAENGWRRCDGCRRLVELKEGCNHITCPCGAEFCYLCGAAWRTCICVVYTEEQLLRRENVVAARDAEAGVEVDRLQIRRQIEQNHECTDHSWSWVGGRHQCEECHHWLPQYIFECNNCRLQACNRCCRNRL